MAESDSSLEQLEHFNGYSSSDLESPNEKITRCSQQNPTTKAINDIMKHKIKFNVSLTSAQDVAKILNANSTEIQIPTYTAALKRHTEMRFEREYLIFCKSCDELCKDGWCKQCNVRTKKEKFNFIITIPLEQQIKASLDENFDDVLVYYNRQRDGSISDYDDCTIFKKISDEHPDYLILSITMNTDGAQISNSGKYSLWPVQLYQNFMPPSRRYKSDNVLLSTIYFGKGKPDMDKILQPLAQEIDWLQRNPIKFLRNGNIVKCIPVISYCSVDLPAKAMLCGLKTYAGSRACSFCLHPGKQITDHLKRKYTRYVKLETDPELRTHSGTIHAVNNLSKKSVESYGLIGIPTMVLFRKFDLVDGFVIDYMHNILLGVMKLLLDFWMGSHRLCKNSRYFESMTPKNRNDLDRRLLALKPCAYITRKPRSIQERSFFKAIEYRNLLLYYLKFGLRGLLEDKYINHFELLSAATYILLKSTLNESEIDEAGEKLKVFADQFEILYGSEAVTMNIHLLRHYASAIKQNGPIWCHAMFGFEKNIGVLGKDVNNSTNVIETITFNYCVARENNKKMEIDHIHANKRKEAEIAEPERQILLEKGVVPLENGKFLVTDSIQIHKHTFKSIKSAPTQSIDHYVEMRDGVVGFSTMYIQYNDEFYILLEECEIIERFYHLIRIKSTGIVKAYSCRDINCKLLYMKFGSFEIVTKEPNLYEIN